VKNWVTLISICAILGSIVIVAFASTKPLVLRPPYEALSIELQNTTRNSNFYNISLTIKPDPKCASEVISGLQILNSTENSDLMESHGKIIENTTGITTCIN